MTEIRRLRRLLPERGKRTPLPPVHTTLKFVFEIALWENKPKGDYSSGRAAEDERRCRYPKSLPRLRNNTASDTRKGAGFFHLHFSRNENVNRPELPAIKR